MPVMLSVASVMGTVMQMVEELTTVSAAINPEVLAPSTSSVVSNVRTCLHCILGTLNFTRDCMSAHVRKTPSMLRLRYVSADIGGYIRRGSTRIEPSLRTNLPPAQRMTRSNLRPAHFLNLSQRKQCRHQLTVVIITGTLIKQ